MERITNPPAEKSFGSSDLLIPFRKQLVTSKGCPQRGLLLETEGRNYLLGEGRWRSVWLGQGPALCADIGMSRKLSQTESARVMSHEKLLWKVILSALLLTQAAFPQLTVR